VQGEVLLGAIDGAEGLVEEADEGIVGSGPAAESALGLRSSDVSAAPGAALVSELMGVAGVLPAAQRHIVRTRAYPLGDRVGIFDRIISESANCRMSAARCFRSRKSSPFGPFSKLRTISRAAAVDMPEAPTRFGSRRAVQGRFPGLCPPHSLVLAARAVGLALGYRGRDR
jgi:hypothetical protein